MNFRPIYLVLCVSTFFMLVQQCFAVTNSLDMHNQKSSDRIAIATLGDSASSEISEKAGRAPYYLIFDGNGDFITLNNIQSFIYIMFYIPDSIN